MHTILNFLGFRFKIYNMLYNASDVTVIYISGYKDAHTIVDLETIQNREATLFKEAGLGAVPKTYPYDPTKVKKTETVKAKSKNT